MQPYFFPYPGYFELISNVDLFVYLTDVQYVNRSWINRNRILSNTGWRYITVPVSKHRQVDKINDIRISNQSWADSHICRFNSYKNIDVELLDFYRSLSSWKKLCPMLIFSLGWMSDYIGISTEFSNSSKFPSNLKGEDRIIELCKQYGATNYVNLPGGKNLYDKKRFEHEGITLEFSPMTTQGELSILDNCFNDKSNLRFEPWTQQESGK